MKGSDTILERLRFDRTFHPASRSQKFTKVNGFVTIASGKFVHDPGSGLLGHEAVFVFLEVEFDVLQRNAVDRMHHFEKERIEMRIFA